METLLNCSLVFEKRGNRLYKTKLKIINVSKKITMQAVSDLIRKYSNWKTLVLFIVIYLSFGAYLLPKAEEKINEAAGSSVGIIDLTFGYKPDKTLGMVAAYSDEARKIYAQTEMTLDILYPLVYTILLCIGLSLLYKDKKYWWINVLPIITLIFDFLENYCIVALLNSFPEQSTSLASGVEIFKILKFVTFGASLLLVIVALINKLIKKLNRTS